MKRMSTNLLAGAVLATVLASGVIGYQIASAQDATKMGTILQRTELVNAKGLEAILVLRELPPGGASGKHTQTGNEIVYVLDGSITLEVQGKPAVKIGRAHV